MQETIPAWRQSIWAGVWDPWPVISRPHLWWKVIRDASLSLSLSLSLTLSLTLTLTLTLALSLRPSLSFRTSPTPAQPNPNLQPQPPTPTSNPIPNQVIRDAWCLEIMHRAFVDGLMEYGMVTAQKPLTKA